MDASLSQSPWQLAVSKRVWGGSILAELLHTCCLTNKERFPSEQPAVARTHRRVTSHHMWSRTGVAEVLKKNPKNVGGYIL